ncbi:hypothetical protein Z042_02325 [Chania multitudinisentens RB-25]|uniref:DUF1120 domain-containing protein n=1 Tax=Chania multitudinisentens RB-25 TaxID=1441930 RepID=W0L8J8_9GAMM|nr:DUF1120 domain-containing protein [Chania multitudinisentens]AHG18587.1 hypothetical protein Z042_02325 [Chania multitudinisentens RB-25]
MKKHFLTLTALSSLLLAVANAQAAAPTAELQVAGKIGSPTCTIAAPNNGVYNLGAISASQLKPDAITRLSRLTKSWTITCDAMTYLTITPTDNRSDSMAVTYPGGGATNHYGLGFVNGTGKIGAFLILFGGNSSVDGVPTTMCKGNPGQCTVQAGAAYLTRGNQTSWATTNNVLTAGRVFKTDLATDAYLASTSTMNGAITENTKIDGSATLNFAFAI